MCVNLHIAGGYFHALLEALSACDREQVSHKVQHMYYPVYHRMYLLTPLPGAYSTTLFKQIVFKLLEYTSAS